jgi:hypothetical protein
MPHFSNKIVYFGEPNLANATTLLSFDPKDKTTKSLDKFFTAASIQNKTEKQELYRYLGIMTLYQYFTDVDIYGTGWLECFPKAHRSNYASSKRHIAYRGSICIDFGSKSGVSCLYNRSIEILLDSGILFHQKQTDSCAIFGKNYCDYFSFENFSDMIDKLKFIRNHDDIMSFHHNLLMNSPLAQNTVKLDDNTSSVYEF